MAKELPAPSDKKPAGIAIVVGSEKPSEDINGTPGAMLGKDFLGEAFDSLKVGDTGQITLRFTVVSKDEKNGGIDMDFDEMTSCDTTDTPEGSFEPEDEEDDMEQRFKKSVKKEAPEDDDFE